jgi:hypothetical protein
VGDSQWFPIEFKGLVQDRYDLIEMSRGNRFLEVEAILPPIMGLNHFAIPKILHPTDGTI